MCSFSCEHAEYMLEEEESRHFCYIMGSYVGFQPYFACSGTHLLYFGTSAPFLYYRFLFSETCFSIFI